MTLRMSVAGRDLKVQVHPPPPPPSLFRKSEYRISLSKRPGAHEISTKRVGAWALIVRRALIKLVH